MGLGLFRRDAPPTEVDDLFWVPVTGDLVFSLICSSLLLLVSPLRELASWLIHFVRLSLDCPEVRRAETTLSRLCPLCCPTIRRGCNRHLLPLLAPPSSISTRRIEPPGRHADVAWPTVWSGLRLYSDRICVGLRSRSYTFKAVEIESLILADILKPSPSSPCPLTARR